MATTAGASKRPVVPVLGVALAFAVGLATGVLIAPGGDAPAPEPDTSFTPSEVVVETSPDPTPEPPAEVSGCDESTAVEAAVRWMRQFTPALYLDDVGREEAVASIAASQSLDELQRITADIAARLTDAGITPEAAADATRVIVPAGYRLTDVSDDRASVAIWSAAVAHIPEVAPLRTTWSTQTTDMACEADEWRLVAISTEDGPVPEAVALGDGELDPTLGVIESFTEFPGAP